MKPHFLDRRRTEYVLGALAASTAILIAAVLAGPGGFRVASAGADEQLDTGMALVLRRGDEVVSLPLGSKVAFEGGRRQAILAIGTLEGCTSDVVRVREKRGRVRELPVESITTVYKGDYVRPGAPAGVGALVGLGAGVVGGILISQDFGDYTSAGGAILCTSAMTVPAGAAAGGVAGSLIRWSAKKYAIGPEGWTIVPE